MSKFPIHALSIKSDYVPAITQLQNILRKRGDLTGSRPIEKPFAYLAQRHDAIDLARQEIEAFLNCERKKSIV